MQKPKNGGRYCAGADLHASHGDAVCRPSGRSAPRWRCPRCGAARAAASCSKKKIGPLQCSVAADGADRGRAAFVIPALPQQAGASRKPRDARGRARELPLTTSAMTAISRQSGPRAMPSCSFLTAQYRRRSPLPRSTTRDGMPHSKTVAGSSAAFMFSKETEDKANAFHARMFAPPAPAYARIRQPGRRQRRFPASARALCRSATASTVSSSNRGSKWAARA